jgi:putative transposase
VATHLRTELVLDALDMPLEQRRPTAAEARMDVFEFIEGWYNPTRRHSSFGYLSPIQFEKNPMTPMCATA